MYNKLFYKNNYMFKNYTLLNSSEKELVLIHRNKNRKWMIQQEEISLESHLQWIETLSQDTTKLYFLVFKEGQPFISVSYHDKTESEVYWGYFLIDEAYKSEVLKIEKTIIEFAFEELQVEKLLCINNSENHVIEIHKFFGFRELEKREIANTLYTVMQLKKSDQV